MSTLVQYVRNGKNHRIGVVVAVGKNQIGWSLCNKTDDFDKQRGLSIAIGRAHKLNFGHSNGGVCIGNNGHRHPQSVDAVVQTMAHRASCYYKEAAGHED